MTEYILTLISQTNRNIFLTGKAGTGKTTLLRKIIATTYKNTVVAAPTGIAALNAGGVTIHSLFQLPFASFLPTQSAPPIVNEHLRFENRVSLRKHFQMHKNKQQLIRNMELLIVDEVSMLRADVLDAMDYMLQFIRRNHEPFGGVQVLFIGDLMQLPPVVKQEEWEVLKQYYKGMYFFQSEVITKHPLLYVELETIYRQTDKLFVSILNHLRENKLTEEDLQLLQPYVKPAFAKQSKDEYVTLTTHNAKADTMNQHAMQQLRTPAFAYEAEVIGDFPEYLYPTDKVIQLKEGARVMFIKNDPSGEHLFFNGKMGTVLSLTEDSVEVLLDGGQPINVERYVWENLRFRLNETTKDIEEEKLGTFTQYPLRLAWAITIHKSQGLTFEKAALDLGSVFASGQAYVAFSRLRSLDGLVLLSSVAQNGIDNDEEVIDYAVNKADESQVQQACEEGKSEFLQQTILQTFDWRILADEWAQHCSSYTGEIGAKSQYKEWANKTAAKVREVTEVAAKFSKQLVGYFGSGAPLEYIFERIEKAVPYFSPLLSDIWGEVLYVQAKIANQKKVKEFNQEVNQLSDTLSGVLKHLFRLSQITRLIRLGKPLTKDSIHNDKLQELRIELQERAQNRLEKEQLFVETTPEKTPIIKQEKPTTYDETLRLWQEGKNVAEIAEARMFTQRTIYNHLEKLIEQGKLPEDLITELLSAEAITELTALFDKTEDYSSLKSIIEATEERYSWNELSLFGIYYKKTAN